MTGRSAWKLLRVIAAIGLGMSFIGLVILLLIAIVDLSTRPMPPGVPQRMEIFALGLLNPFHEVGTPLLLSGILYALCEIGLHLTRTNDPDTE